MSHTGSRAATKILRLIGTFGPKHRQAMLRAPVSPDDLAACLRMNRRRCRRILFDLIVNLTAARAIGLTIPQEVLQQATEVIQ